MNNRKNTKSALITSVIALFLCFAMLFGTTFAWFTDEVVNSNNIIKTGTLTVTMEHTDIDGHKANTWKDSSKDGAIFNYNNWEPGYTDVKYVKITNTGSLAFKYQLNIIPAKAAESEDLAKVIDVYFGIEDTNFVAPTRDSFGSLTKVGTLADLIKDTDGAARGILLPADGKGSTNVELPTNLVNLAKTGSVTVCLALKMQENAGNEYQDIQIGKENGINLQLLASQLTYENDSFDNSYDEDAKNAVNAGSTADFDALLSGATPGSDLYIILDSDIEWKTEGTSGVAEYTDAKSVTIDGQGLYTLTATGSGVTAIGDTETSFTLKNLTVVDESVSYAEAAWEFTYLEFGGAEINFINVDFKDPIMVESAKATFNNCTFVGNPDKYSGATMYGVWVSNGDATFTDCAFTGARGMKICDDYDPEVGTVIIDNCVFDTLSEKPGVAIDDEDTQDMNIIIKNSLFADCQPGDQGLYVYETDNTVPTLENNQVASSVVVENVAELATALSGAGAAGAGNTFIKLPEDGTLDLSGTPWTPIKVDGYHGADIVTVDGQGATIKGLTAPLFAGGFAGGSGIVIKNLTIADSNIVSTNTIGSGAFIESVDSMALITLENCHLKNSTVTGGNGSRTGGLLGWTAGYNNVNDGPVKTYVNISNCSVIGSTITCNGSVGGIYGHAGNNAWTYSNVSDCKVENCNLNSTDDGGWRVGVVVGTANVGELTISGITESGNTLTQTGKTAPAGQSSLYGRFVPGTTGKLVIDGVEIQ